MTATTTSPVTQSGPDATSSRKREIKLSASKLSHSSISNSSSSISSLFERVTIFRRSLIRINQHKRNKFLSRDSSKSKSTPTVTSLSTEDETKRSDRKPIENVDCEESSEKPHHSTDEKDFIQLASKNHSETMQTLIKNSDSSSIIDVDERDAIYGFTSLNLNKSIQRRFYTKQSNIETSETHLISDSKFSSPTPKSISLLSSQSDSNFVEAKLVKQNPRINLSIDSSPCSIFRSTNIDSINATSHSNMKRYSLDRNVDILPSEIYNNLDFLKNDLSSSSNQCKQSAKSNDPIFDSLQKNEVKVECSSEIDYGLKRYSQKTRELYQSEYLYDVSCSVEDVILMSERNKKMETNEILDDNRYQARIYENLKTSLNHQQKSCVIDQRKLTKDSGYESSSTLTSLNYCSIASLPNDCPPVMTSTVGYGKLNLPSTDFEYAVRHFRSDSIPSILERESLDTNNPNYKLDRSERDQIADDSRPPTPPVRYSSLPEHYRHKDNCRINLIATKSRNDLTLQKNSFLLNILYPKMQRGSNSSHKRNISDHQSCIDLSIKSPENIVKDRQNSRFPNERLIQMESKNGSPITAHSTASTSNTSSLKEIQKRAVYEFYLKQKDKLKQKYSKDCDHKVESQSKIDECNGKELFKFNPEHIKAPFDGSKASEASTVNDQETNEDADFPPPPLLSSSEINTDEKLPSVEEILNSRYSELMNICSEVDLTSLIPVLSVVLNDYQCLEDDESNRKDPKDSYGEEEAIEKELIEIDQTHKRKNRLMSNQSLLQMELTRIRKELQTLEDLRLIIHRRLKRIDKVIDDKFNLLSFDIIKIIELTFSLNQQLYQNVCSPSNNQSDQNHLNSLETKAKQIRLQQQLFDAEKLRDIIEKRRLLFIERIERRLNQLNDNQSPNRNEFQIGSSDFISNSRDNLSYSDIIKWCSEEEFSIQKSLLDGTTDLNLSKVVECYLERLKILTIQERLVIFILQQETSDREPK